MNYKIDKDGNAVNIFGNPFEKLEKIKEQMETELKVIKTRYVRNEKSMYPRKLNFNTNITSRLFIICSKFEKVPYEYAISVDLETVKQFSSAFMELWQWILGFYPDFVCSKNLFPAFMGISMSAYSYLLTNTQDAEILTEILYLHGATAETEIISSQSGLTKEKSTITKLGADSVVVNSMPSLLPNDTIQVCEPYESLNEIKKQIRQQVGLKRF